MPDYFPENQTAEEKYSIPSLTALTRKSIQCLQFNLNGYFLVVHNGKLEKACRENNYPQAMNEIEQLEIAIAQARAYAGNNTLILLYSPYAVPGMKRKLPGEPPTGSSLTLPLTKRIKGKNEPVVLELPGPFRPELEFTPYYGWAAIYHHSPTQLPGFTTPYELHQLISAEF
ncbi:MAG: hypothetical protein HC904_08655 [Blastochloris sp.]|nr:hypothetical protein [Blastochloris sp.]